MPLATPSRPRLLPFVALLLAVAVPAVAAPDLFVTSDASNQVRLYGSPGGNFLNVFTLSQAASGQMAIHFNAAGTRVLIGHLSGGVEEYDVLTSAYIKTYNVSPGWQWAGLYAPNGEVYIGSMFTNDVRRYDATTGAFLGVLCPVPGPADMEVGQNGNLFIASFTGGFVLEVDINTGSPIATIPMPPNSQPNDMAWLPSGELLVTEMRNDYVARFSPSPTYNFLGLFTNGGWGNPHGIAIGPHDGNIYVDDGMTGQIHVFDPNTFVELNPIYLVPPPGDKIVDMAFLPNPTPTSAVPTTWGRLKTLYK